MIIHRKGMLQIEEASQKTAYERMEIAGNAIADELRQILPKNANVLFLCGNGNNGGDGFYVASMLKDMRVSVACVDGQPKTDEAKKAFQLVSEKQIIRKKKIISSIENADYIIDAIYGFSFHGEIREDLRPLFIAVNHSKAFVISIDINSGAECDSGYYDHNAIHSNLTLALDCYKPFHMLRKEHQLFKEVKCLSLGFPHTVSSPYPEMNLQTFFSHFPKKKENAYKGTYGKTLLIGGSYGMAGAMCLNILGAKTVGASYITVACEESIYPIVATRNITPVFHPFRKDNLEQVILPCIRDAKAIAFGSGLTNFEKKNQILDLILQNANVPVILDAEALRLLHRNTWILRFAKCPVILTPHIAEFAYVINQPIEYVRDHKIECAVAFAKEYRVYVVLKGPNTIVVSPDGTTYINQSGNQALAQAGSGDLLTGIMAGILTLTTNIESAVHMSVWLHGYLAEYGTKQHSMQNFPLESYPDFMDALFSKYNY